jgi:hypothetical protein
MFIVVNKAGGSKLLNVVFQHETRVTIKHRRGGSKLFNIVVGRKPANPMCPGGVQYLYDI